MQYEQCESKLIGRAVDGESAAFFIPSAGGGVKAASIGVKEPCGKY